jgi:hypothetical protein
MKQQRRRIELAGGLRENGQGESPGWDRTVVCRSNEVIAEVRLEVGVNLRIPITF